MIEKNKVFCQLGAQKLVRKTSSVTGGEGKGGGDCGHLNQTRGTHHVKLQSSDVWAMQTR
jgi:hypothetical protein